LERRFCDDQKEVMKLQGLVPFYLLTVPRDEIVQALQPFKSMIGDPSDSTMLNDIDGWYHLWLEGDFKDMPARDRPQSALETLNSVNGDFYPIVSSALRIFITLPCTTASAERSFSMMKRVKTHIRSTMSDGRLTGLAHLHSNRGISIDHKAAVKDFLAAESRKIAKPKAKTSAAASSSAA
jgi:hypothetical protein